MSDEIIDQLFRQADQLLDGNQIYEARKIYEKICSISPQNAEARMMIGAIDGESGRVDDGIISVQQAIEIDPNYADAYQILGRLLQSQGKNSEACESLKTAVKLDPAFTEAWMSLSSIQGLLEDYKAAEQSCRKTLALDESVVEARVNLANALHALGRDDEAVTEFKSALRVLPGLQTAWATLGTIYMHLGKYEDAENALNKAINLDDNDERSRINMLVVLSRLDKTDDMMASLYPMIMQDPSSQELWSLLVSALSDSNQIEKMLEFCDKVTESTPGNASAWLNRGFALEKLDYEEEAYECYKRSVECAPHWPDALNRFGMMCITLERFDEALYAFDKSLAGGADSAVAHHGYALAMRLRGAPDIAEKHFRIALDKAPGALSTLVQLGKALSDQGRLDEAIEAYHQASQVDSSAEDPVVGICEAYERMGKPEQAYDTISSLLGKAEIYPDALYAYAKLSEHLQQEDKAIELIEHTLDGHHLRNLQKMSLHFRAGSLYDLIGKTEQAMTHFDIANAMKPIHFNADNHSRFIENIIRSFDKSTISRLSSSAGTAKRPVFIVGMPRSGTSLVEQILSMHDDIFAAGELNDLNLAAYKAGIDQNNPDSPLISIQCIDNAKLTEIARDYINKIKSIASNKDIVTDKMPTNYLWLGLVEILFPDACVIHMRRDPLDTCLSCYFRDFNGIHPYAYNLENLGLYYQCYEKLINHWRQVLSIPMLDVEYEELVTNTEDISKRILSFCGLDWDQKVLDFHKSDRQVSTASYEQVRKPVYTSSVGRWKKYEPYLGALMNTLGNTDENIRLR